MNQLKEYGFIVKGSGYRVKKDSAILDSGLFKTTIMGVETIDDAFIAANQMTKDGIEVIELCGGFSHEEREAIIKSIEGAVPIGNVEFSTIEKEKLNRFLNS